MDFSYFHIRKEAVIIGRVPPNVSKTANLRKGISLYNGMFTSSRFATIRQKSVSDSFMSVITHIMERWRPLYRWILTKHHRRIHGPQTYVRRPWLIVSINFGYSMHDCPSAWLLVSIVKNPDAPSKCWKEDRWLVITWFHSMC